MNPTSAALLSQCHPFVIHAVQAADDILSPEGVFLHVIQGVRTYAEQNILFAKGRTTPGPEVTNAPGGFSSHNFGLAVDVVPGIKDIPTWKPDWNVKDPQFQQTVAVLKQQGLLWGGDWVHMKGDYDHFYIGPVNPTAAMRLDFAEGGLPKVYSQYDIGAYNG